MKPLKNLRANVGQIFAIQIHYVAKLYLPENNFCDHHFHIVKNCTRRNFDIIPDTFK